jgi:hypothetical protein
VPSGHESIRFEALKGLLEKVKQEPLTPSGTETVLGIEWHFFKFGIPLPRRPAYLSQTSSAPVLLIASVYYRPGGLVEANEVAEFVERNRRALFRHSVVLAAADGFTKAALGAFRRGKTLDFLSETHWPRLWPKISES